MEINVYPTIYILHVTWFAPYDLSNLMNKPETVYNFNLRVVLPTDSFLEVVGIL